MANSGWIRLHRKVRVWEWYRDGNTFRLFVHLLLSANHCQQKWQGLLIERGQLVTGRKALSEQTGLSVREVRTSLNKLKTTNELIIRTTNKFSVITVNNYDSYQPLEKGNDPQDDSQNDRQATIKRPTNGRQTTTNNNIKNLKNLKKKTHIEKKVFLESVHLSEAEHKNLVELFGEAGTMQRIQNLNDYVLSKGDKYKSHFHTILVWEKKNNGQFRGEISGGKQPLTCEKAGDSERPKYADIPVEVIHNDS